MFFFSVGYMHTCMSPHTPNAQSDMLALTCNLFYTITLDLSVSYSIIILCVCAPVCVCVCVCVCVHACVRAYVCMDGWMDG